MRRNREPEVKFTVPARMAKDGLRLCAALDGKCNESSLTIAGSFHDARSITFAGPKADYDRETGEWVGVLRFRNVMETDEAADLSPLGDLIHVG